MVASLELSKFFWNWVVAEAVFLCSLTLGCKFVLWFPISASPRITAGGFLIVLNVLLVDSYTYYCGVDIFV